MTITYPEMIGVEYYIVFVRCKACIFSQSESFFCVRVLFFVQTRKIDNGILSKSLY